MKKTGVIILMAGVVAWLHPARLNAQNNLPRNLVPVAPGAQNQPEKTELTHFNLDFIGGTPAALVSAIERAEGKPLNAIIPEDYYKVQIPALKMNNVTVPQLFEALMMASSKTENFVTGTYFGGFNGGTAQYQTMRTSYGFRTQGQATDNSVWYFFHDAPAPPPGEKPPPARLCRFFQMAPFLETYTIDDITTAIQTGWKLLDEAKAGNGQGGPFGGSGPEELPKLTFHKDTKLLIAVGDPEKLKLIDSVLEQLTLGLGKKAAGKAPVHLGDAAPAKP